MTKTNIQIRGVPPQTRERVRRRARKRGQSMSEYLLSVIDKDLSMPLPADFARRLARLRPVKLDQPAARDIEAIRNERDDQIDRPRRAR